MELPLRRRNKVYNNILKKLIKIVFFWLLFEKAIYAQQEMNKSFTENMVQELGQ
jgi:hypothetical protein